MLHLYSLRTHLLVITIDQATRLRKLIENLSSFDLSDRFQVVRLTDVKLGETPDEYKENPNDGASCLRRRYV